ncbi:MAG: hypothetical protein LBT09_15915 [Planctomycetaceae bacterium]|nr:hypothetical protein [Planctomycetaceae bacterium]
MKSSIKLKITAIVCILNFALLTNVLFFTCNANGDTAQNNNTTTTATTAEPVAKSAISDAVEKVDDQKNTVKNKPDQDQKTNKNITNPKNNNTKNNDQKNKSDQKIKINHIESINNGWTTVVPNKVEPKDEKISDQSIRVADKRVHDPKNPQNTNSGNTTNNFSIWDALPENVTKNPQPDPKPQPQITTTNPTPPFAAPQNHADKPTPKTAEVKTFIPPQETPAIPPKDNDDDLREPPPITANIKTEDETTDNKIQQKKDIDDEIKEPKKALLSESIFDSKGNLETFTGNVKNTFKTEVVDDPNVLDNTAKNKTDNERKPLTNIPTRTAEEIAKRLNDLEREKDTLEQMLKAEIERENNSVRKPESVDNINEDEGVSRTGNTKETETETETEKNTGTEPETKEKPAPENDKTTKESTTKTTPTPEQKTQPKSESETNTISEKTTTENKDTKSKSESVTESKSETDTESETGNAKVEVVEVIPDFDDIESDEPIKKLINPARVGDPDGVAKLKLMYDEVINGLKSRNITGKYERWKEYARTTLRNSSGINTGSELDGRSRLSWYKKLYNEPVYSVFEAEEFTRQLHDGLSGNHRLIGEAMAIIREKLDVPARNDNGIIFPKCETPLDAIGEVKRALLSAQMHHARAVSTLTSAEQTELVGNLVQTFSGSGCVNGHTIPSRTYGRRLLDMMEKMDKSALHDAAESFIPLLNQSLLDLLDNLPENALPTTLIGGQTFQRLVTPAGDIVIGGRGSNAYDLDSPDFRDVVCVIDLGGDDSYRDGTCGLHRPVLLIIDLHGSDTYTATRPGVQGGSILGVSVLIDVEGDDRYNAVDIAQGSSIGGVGMLFDFAGNDTYKGLRRVQAHALSGIGIIIDREGKDDYHAAMWAQGFGAPAGMGVLEDTSGDDHYYCGGLYVDSYPEHPGYDGWGQGIGAGIRQVANGGIGVLLEGAGNDVYEVDYFGHGGGYWLGAGFARDFGGNDIRHGTTLTAYNGTNRRENKWTRFANGFGCHYSVGYCIDDEGDDVYGGTIMGTGMAWDLSMGYLCDFDGSNKFTATGGMTQGVGAEGSIGILFSYGGNDSFSGRNQAYANSNITYHSSANCGSNFSFVINYGGTDTYGSGAKNNSYVQRGSAGGFLIDRPTSSEAVEELAKLQKAIELRNSEIKAYDEKHETLRKEAAAKGRRYYPRTKRPAPISQEQQRSLTGVPEFKKITPAKVTAVDNTKF